MRPKKRDCWEYRQWGVGVASDAAHSRRSIWPVGSDEPPKRASAGVSSEANL